MLWGTIELEPEVSEWFENLSDVEFGRAAFYVDLLAEYGVLLTEPYSKQLDGKLRELRFLLNGKATRITYWIAPMRRIVLLTVFTKSNNRERSEVARARKAMAVCVQEMHLVEEE